MENSMSLYEKILIWYIPLSLNLSYNKTIIQYKLQYLLLKGSARMKTFGKKLLSMFLAMALVLGMVATMPLSAFAEEAETKVLAEELEGLIMEAIKNI